MYLYVYIYVWKRCHIHTIYICVCVLVIYIYVYILIYVYLYIPMYPYICIYAHECIYIIQFISTCVYVDTVYIHIYISHVYMHACTHVSIGFYIILYTYFPGHQFFYLFWSCYFQTASHFGIQDVTKGSRSGVAFSNSTSLVCGNEFLDPGKVLQKALTHFPQAPRRWQKLTQFFSV